MVPLSDLSSGNLMDNDKRITTGLVDSFFLIYRYSQADTLRAYLDKGKAITPKQVEQFID